MSLFAYLEDGRGSGTCVNVEPCEDKATWLGRYGRVQEFGFQNQWQVVTGRPCTQRTHGRSNIARMIDPDYYILATDELLSPERSRRSQRRSTGLSHEPHDSKLETKVGFSSRETIQGKQKKQLSCRDGVVRMRDVTRFDSPDKEAGAHKRLRCRYCRRHLRSRGWAVCLLRIRRQTGREEDTSRQGGRKKVTMSTRVVLISLPPEFHTPHVQYYTVK